MARLVGAARGWIAHVQVVEIQAAGEIEIFRRVDIEERVQFVSSKRMLKGLTVRIVRADCCPMPGEGLPQ
jgi:hypothetical protein